MRQAFQAQKPGQRYDHAAIADMAKAMSRQQIIEKTGISKGYLAQILTAKGARPKPEVGNTCTEP